MNAEDANAEMPDWTDLTAQLRTLSEESARCTMPWDGCCAGYIRLCKLVAKTLPNLMRYHARLRFLAKTMAERVQYLELEIAQRGARAKPRARRLSK